MTAPTAREVREWGLSLGLPVPGSGHLPKGLIERWNREHPDQPYSSRSTWRPVGNHPEELIARSRKGNTDRWERERRAAS